MFVLSIAIYFLLACFLVWATLFPEGRSFVTRIVNQLGLGLTRATQSGAQATEQTISKAKRLSGGVLNAAQQFVARLSKHKWAVLVGISFIIAPPAAIITLSTGMQLDGYSSDSAEINPQIAALLKGEQLVPPAPLPPDLFLAVDAANIRLNLAAQHQPHYALPLLASASRNWQLLDPEYAQRLLLVFKIMREQHGYEMAILEGYRSPERQDLLSQMGSSVTGAKAFQSYHQYGLASDCAFLRDGKLVISEKDPWAMKGYELYGEASESVGLTWGGRWKLMDFGHNEWRKPGFVKIPPA